jgi:O-antigen/teichoic acid export membrane protein
MSSALNQMASFPTTQTNPAGEVALTAPPLLSAASSKMRDSIVSGMRWTFWLSAASVPFSFGTTVILARISPEAIGTFGLLQIYIGIVSVFLFFGGNAVLIKFVADLSPADRISFFFSYFFVNCIAILPWLVAATLWPAGLRYLFGARNTGVFWITLLYLSPLYILFSASLAALKGMLDLKWAQAFDRVVSVGSFALYVVLYLFARPVLAAHFTSIIWAVYLALVLLVTYFALSRFLRLNGGLYWSRIRPLLPAGFWRYTLGLQTGSFLSFFSGRLDYLLLLYIGGLGLLGKYVALMSLLIPITKVVSFFLDSLLPSLTNTLAHRDLHSSQEIAKVCVRIVVPASLLMAGLLVFFAHPLILLLGPKYLGLEKLLWVAAPFAVIQGVGWMNGIILSAIGRSDYIAVIPALRIVLFLALFFPLWHSYQLLGAVLTWGICELFNHALGLAFVLLKAPFRYACFRTYWPAIPVLLALPLLASRVMSFSSLFVFFAAFVGLVLIYLALAGYSFRELGTLSHFVLPNHINSPAVGFQNDEVPYAQR